MDATIEGLLIQQRAIDQDALGLVNGLTTAQFNWRRTDDRWSIGQCIEHLNITTERYLPVLRQSIGKGRAAGTLKPGPFALGFFERWFLSSMEPPPRLRTRTPGAFVAPASLEPSPTIARLVELNDQFSECVRSAEGLNMRAIRVRSQFGPVWWSMYGTFLILLAHQRRHLWQARQVRTTPGFPPV